jgi:nitrogen fixation protein FixH
MKLDNFKIYWPYFLFGIFVVVIIVNIIYIFIAQKTWTGIYTPNSYRKGVEYNQAIKNVEEQYKLGLKINTNIKKNSYNSYFIDCLVTDKSGNFVSGYDIIYKFKYLPREGFDFEEKQYNVSTSFYNVLFSMNGKWQLDIIIKKGDKIVQDMIEFNVDPS